MLHSFFPSRPARRVLLGALAAGALTVSAPAQAQLFSGTVASDVQGYNLAGGGSYLEGQWIPYNRFRVDLEADPAFGAQTGVPVGTPYGLEFRGAPQPSFGLEGRYVVPSAPWLFATLDYRYEQFDEVRARVGSVRSEYTDADETNANILRLGAGVRVPQTPFYARGEYSSIRFDIGDDDNSSRDDGFGVFGGFAQPVTRWLGVRAEAGYQDLDSLGDGFAWQAGANVNLTPTVALTGGYREARLRERGGSAGNTSARLQEASVGLRFQFE